VKVRSIWSDEMYVQLKDMEAATWIPPDVQKHMADILQEVESACLEGKDSLMIGYTRDGEVERFVIGTVCDGDLTHLMFLGVKDFMDVHLKMMSMLHVWQKCRAEMN
jgi:hypothetical protein